MAATATSPYSHSNVVASGPNFVNHNKGFDYLVKILLIGDSGVGKSCLLLRYCDDAFSESFITTIGIDFKVCTIELNGKKVRLQIWDTAGQDRFYNILPAYYRGAHGVLMCYDVTDEKSFGHVQRWMRGVEEHAPANLQRVLLANKTDISSERVVTREQGEELAKHYDVPLFEASAKANVNVKEAFEALIMRILTRAPPVPPTKKGVKLEPVDPTKKDECAATKCAK